MRDRVIKSPLKLDHGIDAIRLPETSKKGGDYWSAIKKELDVQARELWDTILEAAKGESEAREKFGKMKAKWKSDANTADFQDLIWFLSEAAYVCLRRAKLRFHANQDIDPKHGWYRRSAAILASIFASTCLLPTLGLKSAQK